VVAARFRVGLRVPDVAEASAFSEWAVSQPLDTPPPEGLAAVREQWFGEVSS
jgi:hypothetical protein